MKNKNNEISASEFKKHCLTIMDEIKNNKVSFTITKHKNPVAKIIPIEDAQELKSAFGSLKGMLTIKDDIVEFSSASDWEVIK